MHNSLKAHITILWAVLCVITLPISAFAKSWLTAQTVQLQTLDKITARIQTITVNIGQPVKLGTLEILLSHCAYNPPEEPPEHAAFLTITDRGYQQQSPAQARQVFSGWMFASSPALSGLEHPVYDVTVLACVAE